jgi:NADPH:quinone reductase-like Zn-dependent oxidoreductase
LVLVLEPIAKWETVGVLCEYRIFDEDAIFATPSYLSDDEACTLQVAAMTAWMAMNGTRPLGSPGGKGEVVLIQGTGGVSINGLLIAKASGAEGNLLLQRSALPPSNYEYQSLSPQVPTQSSPAPAPSAQTTQ